MVSAEQKQETCVFVSQVTDLCFHFINRCFRFIILAHKLTMGIAKLRAQGVFPPQLIPGGSAGNFRSKERIKELATVNPVLTFRAEKKQGSGMSHRTCVIQDKLQKVNESVKFSGIKWGKRSESVKGSKSGCRRE